MTYRLLKVIVQPVLVEDDGEHLTERPSEAIAVSAAEWEAYPAKIAAAIAELNGPSLAG